MPDRPQVTVGAGGRPPAPGRRRGAAEAQRGPGAPGGEAERPRALGLRLPRAVGLEQHLTQQLVRWLDDRRRPELERHRVLERRGLPQQGDRVVLGPVRLPQQRPQPLFEDTRHAIFLRALIDRGTHLTEGREVRQVALGARAVASSFCDTTSSHIPSARKIWVVMCCAWAASGAILEYARAAPRPRGAWIGSS